MRLKPQKKASKEKFSLQIGKRLCLGHIFLPCGQLVNQNLVEKLASAIPASKTSTYRVTLVQLSSTIVSKLIHESHILQQLLLSLLRRSCRTQDTLKDLMRQLNSLSRLPRLGKDLLELLDNLSDRVVVRGAVDSLPERLLTVEQDALDELSNVVGGVEKGYRGSGWNGETESPLVVGRELAHHAAGDVGHVEAGKEEGGGKSSLADVGLDMSFRIEMADVCKRALGYCSTLV